MHSGRDKCWARINARFYWHGGHAYVKKMTKECVYCLQKNHQIYRADVAPLIPIPVTPKVMWRIHCDLMGPFTTTQSGNKYVALAICAFTKYLEGMGNFYFSYSLFFHSNILVHPPILTMNFEKMRIFTKIIIFFFVV